MGDSHHFVKGKFRGDCLVYSLFYRILVALELGGQVGSQSRKPKPARAISRARMSTSFFCPKFEGAGRCDISLPSSTKPRDGQRFVEVHHGQRNRCTHGSTCSMFITSFQLMFRYSSEL